ncbi:LicD family protein, partial [Ruminococcus bromii]|uniref:LicD family protein n=1 Tax=Ruminococcus bromii TaxID=40518 RepID=UPI003A91C305
FSSDSLKSMLIQSVENLYFSAAHMYGFSIKVIRCGKIISANSNSEFVVNTLKSAVGGKILNIKNKSSNVSYISANDLISAVLFVACNGADCQAYNACSDDSTVNSAEFALALSDAFENCEVNITSEGCSADGCAVDCTRLKKLGWSSTVNYKDALLISGHEMMNDNSVFMFSDSYDGKLNDIQQILLGFLLEVDRICKKHNIKYFLGGGSLLGAVRHKGFIPWDDDADVMMLRKDYDRFLSVLPSELPNYLFAQTQENEKDSHFPFTKLRINNTLLSTEFTSRFPNIHNGIFLDVLAQDYTSNNAFLRKIHMKATASSRWLVLDKWRGTSVNANSRFSSLCANILRKIFPLGFLQKVQNKLISLHKNMKKPKYLFDSMGRNVSRGAFPAEWLDEAIWVDFENAKLPIPKEYDKYLKYLYGDYMEMIPVSERHVSHDIKQIDLGEYAGYIYKDTL